MPGQNTHYYSATLPGSRQCPSPLELVPSSSTLTWGSVLDGRACAAVTVASLAENLVTAARWLTTRCWPASHRLLWHWCTLCNCSTNSYTIICNFIWYVLCITNNVKHANIYKNYASKVIQWSWSNDAQKVLGTKQQLHAEQSFCKSNCQSTMAIVKLETYHKYSNMNFSNYLKFSSLLKSLWPMLLQGHCSK